jgi:hypothetical protein
MGLVEAASNLALRGEVTIRGHDPEYKYARDTFERGGVLWQRKNAIQTAGVQYILSMLLADAVNGGLRYGITQIELLDTAPSTRVKQDLTDQYLSGSNVVNILYLTSTQGNGVANLSSAKLWLDTGGTTLLATNTFTAFQKTSSLALTVQWTVNLTGV